MSRDVLFPGHFILNNGLDTLKTLEMQGVDIHDVQRPVRMVVAVQQTGYRILKAPLDAVPKQQV